MKIGLGGEGRAGTNKVSLHATRGYVGELSVFFPPLFIPPSGSSLTHAAAHLNRAERAGRLRSANASEIAYSADSPLVSGAGGRPARAAAAAKAHSTEGILSKPSSLSFSNAAASCAASSVPRRRNCGWTFDGGDDGVSSAISQVFASLKPATKNNKIATSPSLALDLFSIRNKVQKL